MDTSVASHAHRKLRRMGRYVPASDMSEITQALVADLPPDVGTIVGCYRNNGGLPTDWIVVTTDGISAMFDGTWRHIPYKEISRVVRDERKDVESDEVRLELRSMSHATMLVNGKDADRGTHDKYNFMMFLESVIGVHCRTNE